MRRRIETFVFTFRQISLICALKESEINNFQDFTNTRRTTINFTLKLSSKQIIFLDTEVFKGPRFNKHILRPPKPTETFQNTHFSSFYPLSVKKGFAYGEAVSAKRYSQDDRFNNPTLRQKILHAL